MARTTPTVEENQLRYGSPAAPQILALDSPAWGAWLAAARHFAYRGRAGRFTAQREQAGHGRGASYWRAYRRRNGQLRRAYLGQDSDLTPARLAAIALALGTDPPLVAATSVHVDSRAPILTARPAAKWRGPPARPDLVPRPHLLARLAAGAAVRLILIAAPAGAGKTTLLSTWLATESVPTAWLALDSAVDVPPRFWIDLIQALGAIFPGVGTTALATLHALQPSAWEALIDQLCEDLAAHSAHRPAGARLILDDYHLITQPIIHSGVARLIEQLPVAVAVVIATRAEPPLPLARWRARGQLVEIRTGDLRFSPAEAGALLAGRLGLTLPAPALAALDRRTEGWAAGLQLAGLALQGRADPAAFIGTLTGDHRYLRDYLADEVLARQPPAVQAFLLQTSLLTQLTGPLCDAVTGQPGGQAQLEALEHANLFLVPLDDERHWYRYHALFGEFLRARLAATGPEQVAVLHRRAAAWYAAQGQAAAGIAHALAGEDWPAAAALVETAGRAAWMRSEIATLAGWLAALPTALIAARPQLGFLAAWSAIARSRLDDVEPHLAAVRAATAAGAPAAPDLAGEITTLRATVARARGDSATTLALSAQALSELAPDNAILRGVIALNQGHAHRARGDVAAASRAFGEAARLGQAIGHVHVALLALYHLAQLEQAAGRVERAYSIYRQILDIGARWARSDLPTLAAAALALGQILAGWGDLSGAAIYLRQASAAAEAGGRATVLREAHQALAALAARPRSAPPAPARPLLPADQPNERELVILRLLAAGLSNAAIAERLILAPSTIKWHMKHLYAKLNAHSRSAAVARARAAGLLPDSV